MEPQPDYLKMRGEDGVELPDTTVVVPGRTRCPQFQERWRVQKTSDKSWMIGILRDLLVLPQPCGPKKGYSGVEKGPAIVRISRVASKIYSVVIRIPA